LESFCLLQPATFIQAARDIKFKTLFCSKFTLLTKMSKVTPKIVLILSPGSNAELPASGDPYTSTRKIGASIAITRLGGSE
jgi:hypothetical protein